MTAHAMEGDCEQCLEAGMSDYISKPIDSRRLIRLVERWGARNHEVGVEFDDEPRDNSQDDGPLFGQVLDIDGALERLDGNRQLLGEMIQFFLEDVPGLVESVKEAIQNKSGGEARRAAHSIKGLAANFGAEQVVNVAQRMESRADQGALNIVESLLPSLETALDVLRSKLEQIDEEH